MNRETKKQVYALLVLFLFLGSSIAYALTYVFPTQQKPKNPYIFDAPLSQQEEAQYIQQNKVIMKFFYQQGCIYCEKMEPILEEIINELGNNLVTEKIDIRQYKETITQYDISGTPTIVLNGKTIDRIEGEATKEDLTSRICSLYFDPVDVCAAYA